MFQRRAIVRTPLEELQFLCTPILLTEGFFLYCMCTSVTETAVRTASPQSRQQKWLSSRLQKRLGGILMRSERVRVCAWVIVMNS